MLRQEQVLNSINTYIQPLMRRVLQSEEFGATYGSIQLDSIESSCKNEKGADRFKLTIPYAKQNLVWNVLFDSQCTEMGPDFMFDDDTFFTDLDHNTLSRNVPSLTTWNAHNKDALLNVLKELLTCYKEHQMNTLQRYQELSIQYYTLLDLPVLKATDVEIIFLPFGCQPTEARFVINVPIDDNARALKLWNPRATLQVTFHNGPNWNRLESYLQLSKDLEDFLQGPYAVNIQQFPSDSLLMDYFSNVKKVLTEKIKSRVECQEHKQNFMAIVIRAIRNRIIEYDSSDYSFIWINLSDNRMICLECYIPLGFPDRKPAIILHIEDKPITVNYPYKSSWNPNEMFEKIMIAVKNILTPKMCWPKKN